MCEYEKNSTLQVPIAALTASMEKRQRFNKAALIEQIGDNNDLMKELFSAFSNDTTSRIKAIETGIKNHEAEAIKGFAHALKGSALNMAFNELARLAGMIEICAEKDEVLTKNTFQKLKTEFQCINKIIDDELAGLG